MIGLLVLGLTNLTVAQNHSFALNEMLPEVTIVPANFTYISNVIDDNSPRIVKKMEKTAASYDVSEHPNFDEADIYALQVTFQEPHARIIASYDETGKIIKSFEKFKNIVLPKDLVNQIMMQYPGWEFKSDTYLVKYSSGEEAKKYYTIRLLKDDNKINLKIDPSGKVL